MASHDEQDAQRDTSFFGTGIRVATQVLGEPQVRVRDRAAPDRDTSDVSAAEKRSTDETPTARVLVVDDSAPFVQMLEKMLTLAGYEVRGAYDGPDGLSLATRWLPDLILLDISMPGLDGYEITRTLRKRPDTEDIPIIAVSAYAALDDKLNGFNAGLNDYVSKPFDMPELIARMRVHLQSKREQSTAKARFAGRVVALFSLMGGVGKTSLAVNLAVALSDGAQKRRVALIDLDLTNGQVGLMLNLPSRIGWGGLTKERKEDPTGLALQDYFVPAGQAEVRALLAPAEPQEGERIDAELVNKVLEFSRQHNSFTIVDTPPAFDDATLTALDASDLIIVLFSPDVSGVAAAARALGTFRSVGYADRRVVLLANHSRHSRDLPMAQIEKALGRKPAGIVPYDKDRYLEAINLGRPYIGGNRDRPTGRQICRLANMVIQTLGDPARRSEEREPTRRPRTAKRGLLSRLLAGPGKYTGHRGPTVDPRART